MSYAIIQTGGKQYKVKSGDILKIEKLPDSKPDTKIELKEILAYGENKTIEVGAQIIKGAKEEANLIKNSKTRTIFMTALNVVLKKKAKRSLIIVPTAIIDKWELSITKGEKAEDGTWKVGISVATDVIKKSVMGYYGL